MTNQTAKTLRLIMPQWQGGNNPPYHFGAKLLAWLAPETTDPVIEVDVVSPTADKLGMENGIVGRSVLLEQARSAERILHEQKPDKLVILGGDCLIDLVPFAYLNQRYEGDLAVLWVDAHPDISAPDVFPHAHAMVLRNLLGEGDSDFVEFVKKSVKPSHVMYAGLDDMNGDERPIVERFGLNMARSSELAENSMPVIEWLRSTTARHIAIHFDLDVLDPLFFRSLLFADPSAASDAFKGIPQGKMTIPQIIRLLNDVADICDVVGLGIAEHLPWDALALKQMLEKLPLIGK